MRQKLLILLLIIFCLSGAVIQAESKNSKVEDYTVFRVAFWPDVWAWPEFVDVYGWNLGTLPLS
jgi:cytochrome c biogenesis protein ResB